MTVVAGVQVRDRLTLTTAGVACEKFHKTIRYAAFARIEVVHESKPPLKVEMARALSLGLTWALSTAFFLYLGRLADDWLGTEPVLTLIGALVGAAAGFYYLYSQLMAGQRKSKGEGK